MKYVLLLISLLTISSNTFGAVADQFNGYPLAFCDNSTQSCKNIARSDAQRIANKGGTPYDYYYGLNFSTAVLERYQMTVYQEPGVSIVNASIIQLDSYAFSYADDLVSAFNDLNAAFYALDLNEVINIADAGFSIEFSLFPQAYADPLECPEDSQLESAADYAKNNSKRTNQFQNAPGLAQFAIILMTKANAIAQAVSFGNQASNNAVRMAGAIYDFGVYSNTFANGDRAKVTLDPQGEQFVVVPGSIIDCNGQLYPEELEPNTEFEFSTTESLQDFGRYYTLGEIAYNYNIPISSGEHWACTSSGGPWVCIRIFH